MRWIHGQGSFAAALKTVRTNRGRSFATMLGIIIGVVAAIVVVSIGEGVRVQIRDNMGQLAENQLVIRPGVPTDTTDLSRYEYTPGQTLTQKDVKATENTLGVKTVVPMSTVEGTVRADDGKGEFKGVVIGTREEFTDAVRIKVEYGGFFTNEESEGDKVVIGSNVAADLFGENVPLGRTLKFRGEAFIVTGILSPFRTIPLAADSDFNNAIFIPYRQAQDLTDNTSSVYEIFVTPEKDTNIGQLKDRLDRKLLGVHGGQKTFSVLTQDQNQAASNGILSLVTGLIVGAAVVLLFVGGIGIMNIMFVSVTERMHEVGIRKAVGATNRQIFNQFMTEALLLSLIGFIVGVAVSYFVVVMLRLFTSLQPVMPWQIVLLSGLSSVLIGVLFGSFPALKAARKDPIEALRHE